MGKFSSLIKTTKTSARLLSLTWSIDPWLLSTHVLTVLIPALTPILTAYVFKLLIDTIISVIKGNTTDSSKIFWIILAGFGLYCLQSLTFSLQDYIGRLYWNKIPITLFQKVLSKISSLDQQYFEDSEFKNTLEKIRDTYVWRPLNMLENVEFALQGLLQIVASAYILFKLTPWAVVAILVVAIPAFISHMTEAELTWGIWGQHSPHRKKFWYVSHLLQERDSIKELKIFQLPKIFLKQLHELQRNYYDENKSLATRYLGINVLFNLVETGAFVGILTFVVFEALAQRISVGSISYYTSIISNFQNGISGLFRNIVKLFEESLYVSPVFEVLDAKSSIIIPEKPVKIDFSKAPLIEFRNVDFTYPFGQQPVFKNFSLTIKPKEKIALVGENGAGKTTLVKLLARFYDVTGGEILINGVNIKQIDLNQWYKGFGVLFQDYVRYEYPAKDNIYFGKAYEEFSLDEVVEAAKKSGADPVIKKLNKQYDQMLGRTFEGGVELSTGQWQKIALARGFLREAPVLILDEPTAAVDAKAEAEIFSKVEKLSKEKTVIIISHRFSTVRNADKIYVIDEGRIKESGSHEELMKLDGQYAGLFKLQAKGYQ